MSVTIHQQLKKTEKILSDIDSPTPRLDAEILLAHVLNVERPYLHAHTADLLHDSALKSFETLVERRSKREPIAYITGKKEFYGREFMVTHDVLIPRSETEELIELTLSKLEAVRPHNKLLDVGCGSGCIGITLKLERPELDVTLCDINLKALDAAKKNAKALGANVTTIESNLLTSFSSAEFDCIVANLPYVDKSWQTSPETAHEPNLALYAEDNGLELIKQLIAQSCDILSDHGLLLLEADPEQHRPITTFAAEHGFTLLETKGYALSFERQVSP